MQFYATISFEENTMDSHYQHALYFQLGCQIWRCSSSELAWVLGIYENENIRTKKISIFLAVGHQDFPVEVQSYKLWTTITNGLHDMGMSQDITIHFASHSFLHLLIT